MYYSGNPYGVRRPVHGELRLLLTMLTMIFDLSLVFTARQGSGFFPHNSLGGPAD